MANFRTFLRDRTDKFFELTMFLDACQEIVVSVNAKVSVMTFQDSEFCLYLTQKLLRHLYFTFEQYFAYNTNILQL